MPVVSTYEALLAGSTWNGVGVNGRPVFITYSFEATPASYLTGLYSATFLASFQAFSAADQALARQSFQAWGEASGITFFEVPAGQGDIRPGRYDFSLDETYEDLAGYAYYPYTLLNPTGAYASRVAGDVFINIGQSGFQLFAHEIGHALGLKHPHETGVTLDPALDDAAHTVMSYNSSTPATALGALDRQAIAHLYGPQSADGSQAASWSWDPVRYVLTQAGGAGDDTLMGVAVADVITGGAGADYIVTRAGADLVEGGDGNDTISAGDDADTVVDGAGNDQLEGDDGADSVSGGSGDDELRGFSGADTMDGGEGADTLESGGGLDRLGGGAGNDLIVLTGPAIVDGGEGLDALLLVAGG